MVAIWQLLRSAFTESVRYLDVHPVLPEDSPASLQESFDALLAPLLLNTALAALKVPSPANYTQAITCTTRALNNLKLSDADKGGCCVENVITLDTIESAYVAKALYRRAVAHGGLKADDEAQTDLVQASQLVKGDAAILGELEKVKERKKAARDKEKKAFKGLFA